MIVIIIVILALLGVFIGWTFAVWSTTDYRYGILTDVILSITGTVLGSFSINLIGNLGLSHFNFYNILAAIIGAILLISLGRLAFTRL